MITVPRKFTVLSVKTSAKGITNSCQFIYKKNLGSYNNNKKQVNGCVTRCYYCCYHYFCVSQAHSDWNSVEGLLGSARVRVFCAGKWKSVTVSWTVILCSPSRPQLKGSTLSIRRSWFTQARPDEADVLSKL